MKITKRQLRRIIRESLNEFGTRQSSGTYRSYSSSGGARHRGGAGVRGSSYGSGITVTEIEKLLPFSVVRKVPGVASMIQRRSFEAGLSKADVISKIKSARIKENEHPRRFFRRLGFEY